MTKEEIETRRFLYQIYATIILFVILTFVSNVVLHLFPFKTSIKIPAQFDDAKLPATFIVSFIISMIVYFASGFAALAKSAYPDE